MVPSLIRNDPFPENEVVLNTSAVAFRQITLAFAILTGQNSRRG